MAELKEIVTEVFSPGASVVFAKAGIDQVALPMVEEDSTLRPVMASDERLLISKVLVRVWLAVAVPKSMVVTGVSLRGA